MERLQDQCLAAGQLLRALSQAYYVHSKYISNRRDRPISERMLMYISSMCLCKFVQGHTCHSKLDFMPGRWFSFTLAVYGGACVG